MGIKLRALGFAAAVAPACRCCCCARLLLLLLLRGRSSLTASYEVELLRQLSALRAEYFNIGDLSDGRMPLAYVQLMQVRRLPSSARVVDRRRA
jgi:hypothetical protein